MTRLPVLLSALLLTGCTLHAPDPLTQVGSLSTGAGLLAWAPDQGGPRQMTPSTREALTDSLLRGEREVAYAARSGQAEGLRDLFAEGALDDARAVTGDGAPYSWAHRVTLHFYAPDGATVSLTDRFTYLIPDGDGALRVAQRTEDRALQLDDGNWRTHHWRVTQDQALPEPTPPGPAPSLRVVQLGAGVDWSSRSEDDWTRDLRAVRELNLDTLALAIDLRPGQPEQARTAVTLALVGRLAQAEGVNLQLDVQLDALSPRALRALHGALGAGPRPAGLAAVLLRPERPAPAPTVRLWRQTIQARFGPLALGTGQVNPEADFSAALTPSFRASRAPFGLLRDVRRAGQLRAFMRAHPRGPLRAGHLYGPGGFLTPDGSFTVLARALTRPDDRPAPVAVLWAWALDLWPLLLAWPAWRLARRRRT